MEGKKQNSVVYLPRQRGIFKEGWTLHIVLKFSRFISNDTLTSPFTKLKNKMQIGTICVAEKVTFGNCDFFPCY